MSTRAAGLLLAALSGGLMGAALTLAAQSLDAALNPHPAPVLLSCGAYEVAIYPHDKASRSDAISAAGAIMWENSEAGGGCTLRPNR